MINSRYGIAVTIAADSTSAHTTVLPAGPETQDRKSRSSSNSNNSKESHDQCHKMQVRYWSTSGEEKGKSTTSEPQLNIYWVFWDILPEIKMPCETPLAFTKVHFVILAWQSDSRLFCSCFLGRESLPEGLLRAGGEQRSETYASYSGAPCPPHWP